MPAVDFAAFHRPKNPLVETAVKDVEGAKVVLHLRTLGPSVLRTRAFDHRKSSGTYEGFDLPFGGIDKGTYHKKTPVVIPCNR